MLAHDLRSAMRSLLRYRLSTALAVLTLALAIGANAALFSAVDAVLLKPLPFPDPARLVIVSENHRTRPADRHLGAAGVFRDWRDQTRTLAPLGAAEPTWEFTLTGHGPARRLRAAAVSTGFLPALGVTPILGRSFRADEEQEAHGHVVILSHSLWQELFAGQSSVLDQHLTLDNSPYSIIGVMPAGFDYPANTNVWVAMAPAVWNRFRHNLVVVGRLKPGVTVEAARKDMERVERGLALTDAEDAAWEIEVTPVLDRLVGGVRRSLLLLGAALGFVLLIGCGNAANVLLARGLMRQKEMAVRAALGATRWHLARQLLFESLVLALMAGGLGILLAGVCLPALVALAPPGLPRLNEVALDYRVVVFTLLVAAGTGILCGLAPAWRTSLSSPVEGMKDAGRGQGRDAPSGRMHGRLMAGQIALTLVLLAGAFLVLRSLSRLQAVDPGVDARNVLTVELAPPRWRYRSAGLAGLAERVVERVRSLPGVQNAALGFGLPFRGVREPFKFHVEGWPVPRRADQLPRAEYRAVTAGYFETLGIPLVAGRSFDARDRTGAPPVVVISEAMAARYWPAAAGRTAPGRFDGRLFGARISIDGPGGPWRQVVGVVGSVRHAGLDVEPGPEMYVPYLQEPAPWMSLAIRSRIDASALASAVRQAVATVDPEIAVDRAATMGQLIARASAGRRFGTALVVAFAALGLLLALTGLYGLSGYLAEGRRREMAVRMALGATRSEVVRLTLGAAFRSVAAGTVVGLAAALMLTRLMGGSPQYSAKTRTGLRLGKPAPTP